MFDIENIKTISDTQRSNFYRAKVVSLDDPLALNRVQIKIFGLTDDEDFPDESQPWCEFQFRDGVITFPSIDDIIWLFFEGNDIFRPVYLGTIYAGMNISCDAGWEKFLTYRPIKPLDTISFKNYLQSSNNPDDLTAKVIAKDVHQQFKNFILPEDNPFGVQFTGDTKPVENTTPILVDGEMVEYTVDDYPVHPSYAKKMPANYKKSPDKMYVWYKTEDLTDGKTWKDILGGWTFYTDTDLQKALAVFPDSIRHTNYRRYQTWAGAIDKAYMSRQPGIPKAAESRPISWDFIPMSPNFFWHPESMEEDSIEYRSSMSFPFGKMNLNSWKYWKQHSIISHDGKSTIELDDNDEYERLRIDFNYGAGVLEFSRAGMNGLDIWTDGIFNLCAGGTVANGADAVNRMTFNKSDFLMRGGKSIDLNAHRNFNIFGGNDTNIVAKRGTIGMMANNGISLGSLSGVFAGKGQIAGGENDFFGTPVISAPAGTMTAALHGNFLFLDGHSIDDGAAVEWMNYFNAALGLIKGLCEAIASDAAGFGMIGAVQTLNTAVAGLQALSKWEAPGKYVSIVKLAGAWKGIQIQGSK